MLTDRSTFPQSTGDFVKSSITAIDTGVQILKQGYDVASPVVQQGIKVVIPYVEQAIDAATPTFKAALPVIEVSRTYRPVVLCSLIHFIWFAPPLSSRVQRSP